MPDHAFAFPDTGRSWFFSWLHSFPSVAHLLPRCIELADGDCPSFAADAVQQNDAAVLHEKPQHAGVELANVAQMNHPAASSGVSQSSFPRRRESRHEELDTRFRGYDKRSKLRGI